MKDVRKLIEGRLNRRAAQQMEYEILIYNQWNSDEERYQFQVIRLSSGEGWRGRW